MPFDPFGDHDTRGYLRNFAGEKDPARIKRIEHHAFAANVLTALIALHRLPAIDYTAVLNTHRTLFGSVYPWAGQDRLTTAPGIAIAKGGHADLFAHPRDSHRAADYALSMANDPAKMRMRPGEIFGALAHSHPFLDGNGRTLLTVHADLTRRAGFHIEWQNIDKASFLTALTEELREPGQAMDRLLAGHFRPGMMPLSQTVERLTSNPGLTTTNPLPNSGPGF